MDCNNLQIESQSKSGVIYVITNNLNDKQYVGQTIQDLKKRLRRHKNDNRPGISQSIKKYGWENFSVAILEKCENRKQLDEREIFWIAKLNTKTPNGYNLTIGGKGGGEHIVTEETRKKLSESHIGHKVSEETRQKMSSTRKAKGIKPPSWKGKHHTEETLKKISAIHKGKKISDETRAKISATLKGRKLSDEHKAKMRESWKKRRKNKFIEGSLTND